MTDSSLIIVSPNGITSVQSATSNGVVQFLDIKFDNIERCGYEKEPQSSIDLDLAKHIRWNYMNDGSAMKADKFSLLFDTGEQAKKFLSAIERTVPSL